jgi:hypothetical protein
MAYLTRSQESLLDPVENFSAGLTARHLCKSDLIIVKLEAKHLHIPSLEPSEVSWLAIKPNGSNVRTVLSAT